MYTSDSEIVKGIKNGDDRALTLMYHNNYGTIENLILKNNGSRDDAKDIYQEAVIVLYKNLMDEAFELTSGIKTYLYSVAWNLWLKNLKKRARKPTVSITDYEGILEFEAEEPVDTSEFTERELAAKKAIEEMGDPCKTILYSFYYFKKSMAEIAEECGYKSAKTAKNQKYKCIKRLQKLVLTALNMNK